MKKLLLLTVLFLTVCTTASQARIRIPVGSHQKITQVMELPDSAYYRNDMGHYINLGYMYTVYEVASIPLWTTEKGMLVGYAPEEPDTYYELDDEMLGWISEDTGIADLQELKSMPFWDAWGGKLLAIAIIAAIFYFSRGKDDDEEEGAVPESPEQVQDASEAQGPQETPAQKE